MWRNTYRTYRLEIKVKIEKTKINCRLTAKGAIDVNAKVIDDLNVPDPENKVLEELFDEDEEEIKDKS